MRRPRPRRVATWLAAGLVLAAPALALSDGLDAVIGKALFKRNWVQAPSSTAGDDGLGPLFNEKSCAACHAGPALNARITANPDGALTAFGLVVRLGDAKGGLDPVYGKQIQPKSVSGLRSEGTVAFHDAKTPFDRLPSEFTPLRGAMAPQTRLGPRQAPSIRGMNEIEAVDPQAVIALADKEARDSDGIRGRPRWLIVDGKKQLGRYGWKASAATLDQQIADAFMLDVGLSSPLQPHPYGDCTVLEKDCLSAPNGRSPGFDNEEVSSKMLDLVRDYLETLKAPIPDPGAPGAVLFQHTGCAACHIPSLPSTRGGRVAIFSDLLLHNMGRGLDDGVGEPGVASFEWRTAPLMGLAYRGGPDQRYLHDGRATTLDAAIRNHGGEAALALSNYTALSPEDRAALIVYLETL